MGIANSFKARAVSLSADPKTVYGIGESRDHWTFNYTIMCKSEGLFLFFDIPGSRMLTVVSGEKWVFVDDDEGKYKCSIQKFCIENDRPIPSVKWLYNQDNEITKIADDFKDKYAAYLLDCIVNS